MLPQRINARQKLSMLSMLAAEAYDVLADTRSGSGCLLSDRV
jgi:hypothetical protein